MLTARFLVACVVLGSSAAIVACGDAEPTDATGGDEAELRGLTSGELAGTIACGETKRVHHPGKPTYRALAIAATKGQPLDVTVSAQGHDAVAWLTTASNRTLATNDDASAGGRDANIVYTPKSTATHHIVFREASYEPDVDFDVTLRCAGAASDAGAPVDSGVDAGPAPSDPFDPASCTGTPMTHADAVALLGGGQTSRQIAPTTALLARTRSCNAVTGCSAWSAAGPATESVYMAWGGDNYPRDRAFDVGLFLQVSGNAIKAVVEEASSFAHCAGCTRSGIGYDVTNANVDGSSSLGVGLAYYYPRWTHTSSGFQLLDTWAYEQLGTAATTSFVITNHCARVVVGSDVANATREVGVLYRF